MQASLPHTLEPEKRSRIFLTGATGFVGGSILSSIYEAHPNVDVKVLIRKEADAKELQSVYPQMIPIIGDLAALPLLESVAADVDFVIHAGGDNVPAICAMIDGLAASSIIRPSPPRLISLTGPRSLIDLTQPITGSQQPNSRPWSDVTDSHTIFTLPKDRMHVGADQAIIAHSTAKEIGTMLVSPGQLWGRGKGHLKKESHAALYYATVKSRNRAFVIGDGSATWSWSSIGDLGNAVVFLMEQSIMNNMEKSGNIGVNGEGYYFVSSGDVSLLERARAITARLRLEDIESLTVERAKEIHPFGHIMWGCGERTRADRLAALGFKPI